MTKRCVICLNLLQDIANGVYKAILRICQFASPPPQTSSKENTPINGIAGRKTSISMSQNSSTALESLRLLHRDRATGVVKQVIPIPNLTYKR
jgi:hypothetical protein